MFNERDCHIWRRMLTARGLFCSAQSGAILRFDARGNHDERDGGIRNCGRRRIADLLRADDAIAAPARRSPMVWRQFRVRRRQSIMPAATAGASSTGSAATIPHPIVRAIRATEGGAAMAVAEAIDAARSRTRTGVPQ